MGVIRVLLTPLIRRIILEELEAGYEYNQPLIGFTSVHEDDWLEEEYDE